MKALAPGPDLTEISVTSRKPAMPFARAIAPLIGPAGLKEGIKMKILRIATPQRLPTTEVRVPSKYKISDNQHVH